MHIRTRLKPRPGHQPLERLNAGHTEELFATIDRINTELAAQRAAGIAPMDVKIEGDERHQSRNCGPTTQLRVFATLRAAHNTAKRQRKITWNPCEGVELEQPETTERQRWTPAEAVQFIDAIAGDEMGLMSRVVVLRAPPPGRAVWLPLDRLRPGKAVPQHGDRSGVHGGTARGEAADHPDRREAARVEGQDEGG